MQKIDVLEDSDRIYPSTEQKKKCLKEHCRVSSELWNHLNQSNIPGISFSGGKFERHLKQ